MYYRRFGIWMNTGRVGTLKNCENPLPRIFDKGKRRNCIFCILFKKKKMSTIFSILVNTLWLDITDAEKVFVFLCTWLDLNVLEHKNNVRVRNINNTWRIVFVDLRLFYAVAKRHKWQLHKTIRSIMCTLKFEKNIYII